MPCESVGYLLKPASFFKYNPGVDLPHIENAASKLSADAAATATATATADTTQNSKTATMNGTGAKVKACCASAATANGHAATNGHHHVIVDGAANGLTNGHTNSIHA